MDVARAGVVKDWAARGRKVAAPDADGRREVVVAHAAGARYLPPTRRRKYTA